MMTMTTRSDTGEFALSPALARDFVVGEWLVQPARNRLQRVGRGLAHGAGTGSAGSAGSVSRADSAGAIERPLEPRLMNLLCFLAANGDKVLQREQLTRHLWPKVIVNENSLTRAVSELRKHLTLPGATTQYIETISKKGYRLLPVVTVVTESTTTTEATSVKHPARTAQTTFRTGLNAALSFLSAARVGAGMNPGAATSVAASVGLAFVLAVSLLLFNETEPNPATELSASDMDASGSRLAPAIDHNIMLSGIDETAGALNRMETPVLAPNGTGYAYIEYGSQGSTIYMGNLEHPSAPQVVYSSALVLSNLTWSPLGNKLIFLRQPIRASHAVFNEDQMEDNNEDADLLQLNLDTLEVHRLVPERDVPRQPASNAEPV
ncbi:MAG: winged helix-turn-helix domain-containing protein [Pseudohongiellaceae bacterium]